MFVHSVLHIFLAVINMFVHNNFGLKKVWTKSVQLVVILCKVFV